MNYWGALEVYLMVGEYRERGCDDRRPPSLHDGHADGDCLAALGCRPLPAPQQCWRPRAAAVKQALCENTYVCDVESTAYELST